MNRMYMTARPGKVYHTKEEILSDWHEGVQFRVYQGTLASNADVLRMRMAGFTHICFIWQDPDNQVQNYDLELK